MAGVKTETLVDKDGEEIVVNACQVEAFKKKGYVVKGSDEEPEVEETEDEDESEDED